MTIGSKLQIKSPATVSVLGAPEGIDLELPDGCTRSDDPASASDSSVVIAFVRTASGIDTVAAPVIVAARDDRLAWIAYPKAGQLSTDLNRDSLAQLVRDRGGQPVRQVAIDDTWSALRFRPQSR
ncbi:hypothetical protein [Galbitalea soli]|uniref:DUF3052 domain-containing protein n=1 Tax=Galbitalea soli TaxID=1268042 RepID=A0A7C9TRG9_9MICO|nr:hypothetical protein [Galbitalea soli]NEM91480.1 hypothetical protein [Galbitalea soli]NYJ30174.1 hypothetical protein [Galbitalea soli]